MTIDVNNVQVTNANSITKNDTQKVAFRGTTSPIPNDSVEISSKKKGISNGAKIASILGAIGVIVGGILLHKHFSAKSATEAVQQTTKELSQAVKDLVSQGRITQKEAEMFNEIHNLEGEEFVTKAYELIAKDMGFEKFPKLIVSLENKGNDLGHAGQDITIYLRGYEKFYGKENAKAEIINSLRHELQHYKQDIIIYTQKGEKAYREAFEERKHWDIVRKATLRNYQLGEALNEEAAHYGYTFPKGQGDINELKRIAFEHDTPIKTIRELTPCDIEKLNLSRGELEKADEFLVGQREYVCAGCFPDRFRKPDKTLDYDKIREDFQAKRIMDSYMGTGYWYNPIEVDAKSAGELLRDKFEAFLAAIK